MSLMFLTRNPQERGEGEDPELCGVMSLMFLIRIRQREGGGSGAFRSDFLDVFDKEPKGNRRG